MRNRVVLSQHPLWMLKIEIVRIIVNADFYDCKNTCWIHIVLTFFIAFKKRGGWGIWPCPCTVFLYSFVQGILKGEVSLYHWPSVLLVRISPVLQIKTKNVSCHEANSKPVKQEVNSTVIFPPLVFLALSIVSHCFRALLGLYSRQFTMYGSNNLDPVGNITLHVLVFVFQKANKSQLA